MKIIGIGGTNGSGKDVLSEILADDYGWLFISSSRDLLIPELKRRGLPAEREHMSALSAEWNRQSGTGALIDKAVERFNELDQSGSYQGLVISSIRHPWEVKRIHELKGKIVWIDADPKIRYGRIFNRGQGDKDKKSFQEFLEEEEREMVHSGDEATLNWQGVKDRADIFITNDYDNLEDFKQAIQESLSKILG
jgi:dephospho-CoA kinase